MDLEVVAQRCQSNTNDEIVVKTYRNFIVLSKAWRQQQTASSSTTPCPPPPWYHRVKFTLFKYSEAELAKRRRQQQRQQQQQQQKTKKKRTTTKHRVMRSSSSSSSSNNIMRGIYRQHCNVAGLRALTFIPLAIDLLAGWLGLTSDDLFLTVDNMIATGKLPCTIDNKAQFIQANDDMVAIYHQLERFPSLIIKPFEKKKKKNKENQHHLKLSTTTPSSSRRQQLQQQRGPAVLLYGSGSIVVSGIKCMTELDQTHDILRSCLTRYQQHQS